MALTFRSFTLVLLAVVLQLSLLTATPLFQNTAAAAAAEHPQDTAEKWLYYRGMWACLERGLVSNPSLKRDKVLDGHWNVYNTKEGFGYLGPGMDDNDDNDGTVKCDDGSIWVRGATIFGFSDAVELLCAINRGLSKVGDGSRLTPNNSDDCEKSTSFKVVTNGKWQSALTEALSEKASRPRFHINDNTNAGSMKYIIGMKGLEIFCGNGTSLESGVDDLTNDSGAVLVDIVGSDGKIQSGKTYRLSGDRDNENDKVDDAYYKPGGNSNEADDLRCHELAKMTRDNSAAYATWVRENPDSQPEVSDGNTDSATGGAEDDKTTCALEGVGWIICPVVIAISKFNDSLFAILEQLLGVNPSMFDTSGRSAATYNTWQTIRNLANVAFVISFMVIIYSQLTGAGISNYGIKKMLPRLAIAAILVNVSFWICAVAVDLSNIAGSSLHDLLTDQVSRMGGDVGGNLGMWDKVGAWLLAGGVGTLAVGGAALTVGTYGFLGALALLIPLAVIALIAALTVVFVLVARQAFIIILVVLSPLAFVAYLLPNTEQWFDRWRKTLFTLLLIYPLMALLFGGAQVAAAIIRNGADDALVYILSLVVLVVPLFTVPFLLKFSGGVLGKIGGMVNNPNRGPFDRMKKGGARFAERRRGNRMGQNVDRTNSLREGSGRVLGSTGSRRRRAATWLSGVGNTNVKDASQKDEYAKASSEAALRNYVANRAAPPVGASPEQTAAAAAYATSLAGGNAKMASLVQSYAQQAKEEERRKDVAAEVQNMEHAYSNDQIRHMANTGTHTDGSALSEDAHNAAMQLHLSRTNSHGIQDTLDTLGNDTKAIQAAEAAKAAGQQLSADQEALLSRKHDVAQLQKTAVETLEKTGRTPVTLSGSMRSEMKEGTMARSQEDRFIYSVNAGKISAEKVAKMDVDEMQRMADDIGRVLADPKRASEVDRAALDTVISEITKARTDPILGAKFGAQENKQLDRLIHL